MAVPAQLRALFCLSPQKLPVHNTACLSVSRIQPPAPGGGCLWWRVPQRLWICSRSPVAPSLAGSASGFSPFLRLLEAEDGIQRPAARTGLQAKPPQPCTVCFLFLPSFLASFQTCRAQNCSQIPDLTFYRNKSEATGLRRRAPRGGALTAKAGPPRVAEGSPTLLGAQAGHPGEAPSSSFGDVTWMPRVVGVFQL